MSEAHAKLSASGSHKWLHCPPSIRMEEGEPESTSQYAEEGRLAHELGELKLRKAFTDPMSTRTFNAKLKTIKEHPLYLPEMQNTTDVYLNHVSEIVHRCATKPYVAVEKRLDFSEWVPEGFGTGDCIIIFDKTIHVIDYKHGKGVPVYSDSNSQMMLYAISAWNTYKMLYDIQKIVMTIVQPRLDNISESEINVADLLAWGETVKPIAIQALAGEGECNPGDWCRWCKAKAKCRARADNHTALEVFKAAMPPILTNDEIGDILIRAENLSGWIADLQAYALNECLSGRNVPGWKVVEGRAIRQFTDQEAAFKVLKDKGTEEAMLYERKPLTLAKIETLIGKPTFRTLLSEYVTTPPGKPALVSETDKREPMKRQTANDVFANYEGGLTDE